MQDYISESNRSLRVAQVVGRFDRGGAERMACNMALSLQPYTEKSLCIAIRSAGVFTQQQTIETVALGVDRLADLPRAVWRFRKTIRRFRLDVLHVHGTDTLAFCVLAMKGMWRRPRLFFTWHDSQTVSMNNGMRGRLLRHATSRCETIFGSSESVVTRLRSEIRQTISLAALRNGVPQHPPTTAIQDEVPLICFCARLVPNKEPQMLLRAAARLRDEGLKFRIVIAGDAPPVLKWYETQTIELAKSLKLNDLVTFEGWVDDIASVMRRSAIGVQTSQTEGLSMTLLEQMMVGLAVIATDVGDTSVAIIDGQCGYLIPHDHETALVDRLRELILDPNRRASLGQAARKRALEHFSLDAIAKQALAAYHRPFSQASSRDISCPPNPQ